MTSPSGSRSTTASYALGCGVALAVALLAFGVMIALTFASVSEHDVETAHSMGELVGSLLCPVLVGALLAGIAWTRLRWLGAVLGGLVVLGSASIVVLAVVLRGLVPQPARDASASERAVPVATADGRLLQGEIGLELPAPDGLTYVENDPQIASVLAREPQQAPHLAGWRWTSPDATATLLVIVDLEAARSSTDRAEYVAGVVQGAQESLTPQGFTDIEDEVRGPLDHVIRARLPGGAIMMRVFAYEHGDRFVVATVSVAAADLRALEPIAEGARGLP